MAAIVSTLASWLGVLIDWLVCWFNTDWLFCGVFNLFFDILGGGVAVLIGALAWVPVLRSLRGSCGLILARLGGCCWKRVSGKLWGL